MFHHMPIGGCLIINNTLSIIFTSLNYSHKFLSSSCLSPSLTLLKDTLDQVWALSKWYPITRLRVRCCIKSVLYVCTCVCLCVCLSAPPWLLITSGIMWSQYDSLNKFYNFLYGRSNHYVSNISRHGLTI